MKTLLKLFIVFTLLSNAYCLTAQSAIGIGLNLDNKLTFLEDDYGNKPFTFDGSFKLSLQGQQRELGYSQYSIKYEYANLSGGNLHRYGAEVGYVFEPLKNIGVMPFVGYGHLARKGDYLRRSWEFGGNLSLRLLKWLKINSTIVYTQRPDLPKIGFRLNFNTGLQFDINTDYHKNTRF